MGIQISNNGTAYFKDQLWLVAHNAWNTTPPLNNQCYTITELLDYGVRGFSLDIYGDDEASLHLQHGHDNPASATPWSKIHQELKDWLTANDDQIVTLFFESYLAPAALRGLDNSLKQLPAYVSGKLAQQKAIDRHTLSELVGGYTDAQGNIIESHRLFAFLEKEPDEGPQALFPVMTRLFAENVYGDDSLREGSWTNLRDNSNRNGELAFMNHFGNAPSGSEWDRNDPELLEKHAKAFLFSFSGRYPNFISLDYINWDTQNKGPIQVVPRLQSRKPVNIVPFQWIGKNDADQVIPELYAENITGLAVEYEGGAGIVSITPVFGANGSGVTAIQLYNQPRYGIVNLRFADANQNWGAWLTPYETPNGSNDGNLATYQVPPTDELVGICCRTQEKYGVTDFAIATRAKSANNTI